MKLIPSQNKHRVISIYHFKHTHRTYRRRQKISKVSTCRAAPQTQIICASADRYNPAHARAKRGKAAAIFSPTLIKHVRRVIASLNYTHTYALVFTFFFNMCTIDSRAHNILTFTSFFFFLLHAYTNSENRAVSILFHTLLSSASCARSSEFQIRR